MPPAALPQPVAFPAIERAAAFTSSPEFDLLLACCAEYSNQQRAERIRKILACQLDWERLIQLTEQHGVVPQVYRCLSAAAEVVPSGALEALRRHDEANVRQTLWLTRELLRILECLHSLGIATLPYKGPVLAEILFGNVALRQFSDLDVLIHAADVAKTKAALTELGYEPGIQLTQREERSYLASGYEYTFDSARGRNLLEVQWQILPRFYSVDFDVDGFFDGAVPVSIGGHSIHTLSVEDLMLVLCVHAGKHVWVQLSWLYDIAELARSPRLDWDTIQHQARRLGIERIVLMTFFLAHKLLRTPLPAAVQKRLPTDRAIEALADQILPVIAESVEYNTESISYFRLMMELRERWQDRARFLWRLVFTPSVGEWSAVRLPGPLFPLYRAVRAVRLAKRLVSSRSG